MNSWVQLPCATALSLAAAGVPLQAFRLHAQDYALIYSRTGAVVNQTENKGLRANSDKSKASVLSMFAFQRSGPKLKNLALQCKQRQERLPPVPVGCCYFCDVVYLASHRCLSNFSKLDEDLNVLQSRSQKVFNRGLYFCSGGLDILKFDKNSTDL